MAGERSYVQIPPDSTGKKIRHEPFHRVGYSDRQIDPSTSEKHIWQLTENYRFVRSGVTIVTASVFQGPNSDTGYLGVKFPGGSDFQNVDLAAGDDIQHFIGGSWTTVATVTSDEVIHIPYTQISGGDSPHNVVNVDSTGSMNMRFAEGLPQLDAFGKLRVSGATILGDYVFSDNYLPQYFSTTKYGSGAIIHDGDLRALEISTDTSTATAEYGSGAHRVQHTSNTYHHYFPGFSQTAIMTVALNDPSITGVMREWGYYDDDNGYFFRVMGETSSRTNKGLELCIRSIATGVVTETFISKTGTEYWVNGSLSSSTSDGFNGDPVDGTGDSQMTLDVTDDNIYWVDIQWLGAGRVRYGTYYRGQRIVIHEYYHEGTVNSGKPHSQTGSLPLRYCIHNMTGQAVNDTAKLKAWCASIITEAQVDLSGAGTGHLETLTSTFSPDNLNDWKGENDIGKGDRGLHVVKTGVVGDTGNTTITVANLAGIKPRYRLHKVGPNITNITGDGANVTVTTTEDHGFTTGTVVTIRDAYPSTYNVVNVTVNNTPTANTFTFASTLTDTYVGAGEAVPGVGRIAMGTEVAEIVSSTATSVDAANISSGTTYTIEQVGTTDFVADFGASDNLVGVTFTATANGTAGSGTGTVQTQATATVELSAAPTVTFDGDERFAFHMHVNDEYNLIGVLSPVGTIADADHTNRTLYIPQSMQVMAYHEDGTDAFVEVEVYADSIISGNDMAMPISSANGLVANPTLGAPLKGIEPNNPFVGVESYINNNAQKGRVNYFGEGFHQLAIYIKGSTDRQELGGQYSNLQSGAFKLRADNGGNNRCPILNVFQSAYPGQPTTVRINTPPTGVNFSRHREGNPLQFEQIPGLIGTDATYGINDGGTTGGAGQTFYVRHTSLDTLELYLDEAFTQPWDTSGLDNTTNGGSLTWPGNTGSVATGGFILSGYGEFLYFNVVAKAVGPSATANWYKPVEYGGKGPITVHYVLTWNEINQ